MCGADTFYTVKSIFLVFPHLYTYTQLLSKRKGPLKEYCILEVAYCAGPSLLYFSDLTGRGVANELGRLIGSTKTK